MWFAHSSALKHFESATLETPHKFIYYFKKLGWKIFANTKENLGHDFMLGGYSKPLPTSALWRMDGKWSQNNFLLGFSSLANHGG
jgi:hypothetical protein